MFCIAGVFLEQGARRRVTTSVFGRDPAYRIQIVHSQTKPPRSMRNAAECQIFATID
jgi:hypothetical protein